MFVMLWYWQMETSQQCSSLTESLTLCYLNICWSVHNSGKSLVGTEKRRAWVQWALLVKSVQASDNSTSAPARPFSQVLVALSSLQSSSERVLVFSPNLSTGRGGTAGARFTSCTKQWSHTVWYSFVRKSTITLEWNMKTWKTRGCITFSIFIEVNCASVINSHRC